MTTPPCIYGNDNLFDVNGTGSSELDYKVFGGCDFVKNFDQINNKIYATENTVLTQNIGTPELLTYLSSDLNTLSMKFSLPVNMKMPTTVGIFIFISRENFMLSNV